MAKLIAIWGSPHSGITTFAIKLAKTIYNNAVGKSIICIHCGYTSPELSAIFPKYQKKELKSIGNILSEMDITKYLVLQNLVYDNNLKNMGHLGYVDGDNKYSYADYTDKKANELIDVALAIADYVIVDCGSRIDSDKLAKKAIMKADIIYRMCSPTYKSISFFSSQLGLKEYADTKYKMDMNIPIMTICDKDIYIPLEEITNHFKDVKYTIPYTRAIKQQTYDGKLTSDISDKKYNKVMLDIYNTVVKVE